MLAQKTRYALKALVYIAASGAGERVMSREIAARQQIPHKFLELILRELAQAGILVSQRGRSGGYVLARPADRISFGEVIRLIEGPLALVPCVSRTAYQRCADCQDENLCAIRLVFADVREASASILDRHTLASALAPLPARSPVKSASPARRASTAARRAPSRRRD
jgi:Rrf2 family protein